MSLQLRVYVPDHPIIQHWLAIARDAQTPPALFKTAMVELGRWLTYEAVRRWLPTVETQVTTPLTTTTATVLDPRIKTAIIPILRAGLAPLEGAQTVIPFSNASVYHLGLVRDEETLEPQCYLNRLPAKFEANTYILILEPMLATGGSICKCLEEVTSRGATLEKIRVISIIAAHQALQKLAKDYADLQIHLAMIDAELNSNGYIVPGLGDAGDRAFGT